MKLLIKNGRLVDPASGVDKILDIFIDGEKIVDIARGISKKDVKVIDAKSKVVMPGIVDMHVHLREPGREDKETVASGTRAAAKGGVTTVLAMPNTNPAIDREDRVKGLKTIIKNDAQVNVLISTAITQDRLGKELTNFDRLNKLGVIAITDDGSSVNNPILMQRAFEEAQENGLLVICHCEDREISSKGVVNLGFISTCLGLRGISKESEYKRVLRDIQLAEQANARLHIAHVSCRESIEIIAEAKKKGVDITAETAPHYFSLNEEAALDFDTNKKMNPPLRSTEDVDSIKQGLAEGVIDVIASDHAPHTENEKDIEFDRAEFGVIGLETELAVSITELVNTKLLSWLELVDKLSYQPAEILGLDKGRLSIGKVADIVIVSPDEEWVVKKENIISKSKNSCFLGKRLKGNVDYTICNGKIVYRRDFKK